MKNEFYIRDLNALIDYLGEVARYANAGRAKMARQYLNEAGFWFVSLRVNHNETDLIASITRRLMENLKACDPLIESMPGLAYCYARGAAYELRSLLMNYERQFDDLGGVPDSDREIGNPRVDEPDQPTHIQKQEQGDCRSLQDGDP